MGLPRQIQVFGPALPVVTRAAAVVRAGRRASVARAERRIGGTSGDRNIAEPAALRNRFAIEKPSQVIVATLTGKMHVERPGSFSRIDR